MISIQNDDYSRAWKTFYPEGNGKAKRGYVLHHKDWSLRHNDLKRYLEWRIDDLEMMTKSEHMKLHQSGNNNISCHLSEDSRLHKSQLCRDAKRKFIEGLDNDSYDRYISHLKKLRSFSLLEAESRN